jgi:GDP-4-dehydro-6-deoxy-D-mannose reductase
MRVLVFGATGFAGVHLVAALRRADHQICAVEHRSAPTGMDASIERARCDLRDADGVAALLERYAPDAVVNLAGLASPPEAHLHPAEAFDVNVLGPIHLLEAVARRADATRVLMVSSSEVYGKVAPENFPVTEQAPLAPAGIYGATKAAVDTATRVFAAAKDVAAICVRPFNHTGPGQGTDFVCADFATQLAEIALQRREPLLETGNLEVTRDFTDVRDIARGYVALLERGMPGEAYNLCSGREVLLTEMVKTLCEIADVSPEIRTVPERWRPADVPRYWGSASKARSELDWSAEIPWRRTLEDLYRDCLERIR